MRIRGKVAGKDQFLGLLGSLVESKKTGALIVTASGVVRGIFVEEGAIVAATSTNNEESLGNLLVERGIIQEHDLYNAEDEILKALGRKVPLKSGGYLIFDQTEAMTTIDVNTGAFVGHRNLEETLFKTNMEATIAIGRQLRLRNPCTA